MPNRPHSAAESPRLPRLARAHAFEQSPSNCAHGILPMANGLCHRSTGRSALARANAMRIRAGERPTPVQRGCSASPAIPATGSSEDLPVSSVDSADNSMAVEGDHVTLQLGLSQCQTGLTSKIPEVLWPGIAVHTCPRARELYSCCLLSFDTDARLSIQYVDNSLDSAHHKALRVDRLRQDQGSRSSQPRSWHVLQARSRSPMSR
jgi:hypothetical protein